MLFRSEPENIKKSRQDGFQVKDLLEGFKAGNETNKDVISNILKGSCFSTGYKCTSFYFSLNSTCYLFECSYDTFQYIKTHMDEFKQYKQFVIAISHIHEDHVGGLGSFLYWLKYAIRHLKCITRLLIRKTGYGN